jgi:hypothetical protein
MRAFPTDEYFNEQRVGQHPGMDLRDYFAGQVINGLSCVGWLEDSEDGGRGLKNAAEYAYRLADAMVRARGLAGKKKAKVCK